VRQIGRQRGFRESLRRNNRALLRHAGSPGIQGHNLLGVCQDRGGSCAAELFGSVEMLQALAKLPAEDGPQDFDRQEERLFLASDPTIAIRANAAARNDAMQVRMV